MLKILNSMISSLKGLLHWFVLNYIFIPYVRKLLVGGNVSFVTQVLKINV